MCHQVGQYSSGQLNTLRALVPTVAEGWQAGGISALEVLPQADSTRNPSTDC